MRTNDNWIVFFLGLMSVFLLAAVILLYVIYQALLLLTRP